MTTPIVKENINEELIIKLSKRLNINKKISEEDIEQYYNHFKD